MVSIDEINTKMIELEDAIEGECVNNTDFYFDQIGEPLPIKPSDSDSIFDLQALPSQPLAVSELHRLIFVADSDGFCVARTKDAIDSAKSSPSSSIQELSIVDVPIGKVHILALSTDNSTLAASVASHIHFFSVSSLLNQEVEPSFSCSVDETSFVKDFRWRKKSENSYVVLSNSGKLYHGAVDGLFKEVMDNVDAVEWSAKGKFVAVARKNVLSIMSSRFKERFCMSLSFKSLIGDSDCSAKVDSIRWVRPDCIILGCFRLTADGQEENYIVQVIRNKDGKITDASSEPVVLSFDYLFEGFYDDILPFGTGPHLFLSYLEQCELAITANRKNTETHIVFLGWSLGDELNEVAVIDIEREKWKPKIGLQDNGDDNLILGLCVDKVSLYEKVKIQLGVDERIELSPYCILLCLTLEGKLVMFHVASTRETAVTPEVISAPSEEEDEVVDTHAAVPVQCDLSKSLGLDKPESEHVSLGFQLQEGNKKEPNMKGVGEIFKRTDPKPSDSVSPVVASPVSFKDSILKNLKVESQLNSFSFEAACAGTAGEDFINEPTMPTFDLDPSKSRKTTGESSSAAFHRVNVQDFMEMFNKEGENDKSAEDFYTLSGVTVKFLRFDVPVEGLPLLVKILLKHPDFMSRCTYGNAVRKVMFQSLVAVLLDMERTPLKSLNLHKVLEWKNVLCELQSMKFDVEFILDWLKTTAASCIIRDGEIKLAELVVKIANLEKEIEAKSAELSSLTNQRNSIMLSLSTSGGSSSAETFGEGLLD